MSKKLRCVGCKFEVIELEDTDEANVFYGICHRCGYSYTVHAPLKTDNNDN